MGRVQYRGCGWERKQSWTGNPVPLVATSDVGMSETRFLDERDRKLVICWTFVVVDSNKMT